LPTVLMNISLYNHIKCHLYKTYLAQRLNSHGFASAALIQVAKFARRFLALFLEQKIEFFKKFI